VSTSFWAGGLKTLKDGKAERRFDPAMAIRTFQVRSPSPWCELHASLACNGSAQAALLPLPVHFQVPVNVLSGIPLSSRCILSVTCSLWPLSSSVAEIIFDTGISERAVRRYHLLP
jgi:hypothetical protein